MLPLLLSIPHGGMRAPSEIDGRLCITKKALFDDSDSFSIDIYDLGDRVHKIIKTDVARAYVDLNRPMDIQDNPDGLIKKITCYQERIYRDGMEPDHFLTDALIESYYLPYHREIKAAVCEPGIRFGLDCHTMASVAPNISPDGNGKKRPAFCLSNQGNKTSSREEISLLARCISESFPVDIEDIALNDPFLGGHITRTYGNNPIPWIQIEMNRDMYLSKQWFDFHLMTVDAKRLSELNGMFENALTMFCDRLI